MRRWRGSKIAKQTSEAAVAAAQAITLPQRQAGTEIRTGAHRERLVGRNGRSARLLRGARPQRFSAMGVSRSHQRCLVCARAVRLKQWVIGMNAYAELHCLSNFTFLCGASHPEELVERAHELGYTALAVTDECSLAGVVRAHVAAKACGLKLILGSEIRFDDGPSIVLLATNRTGYGNLSELITLGRRSDIKGRYSLALSDIRNGLPGCLALLLPEPLPSLAQAQQVAAAFPESSWLAVELFRAADDTERLSRLTELGAAAGLPLVAAGNVHMHVAQRRALQDTLTAIRLCVPVFEAGATLYPNGERHLREHADLARIYPPELLE